MVAGGYDHRLNPVLALMAENVLAARPVPARIVEDVVQDVEDPNR
jgi:hypothetical protein